ncbi:MAG: methyltransferase domain-containing protein [Candidatus Latescibacteria bacterium]|nr:methyltransferase domain-containing protein [Candidatus Latescibacterota bacterium]
MSKEYFDKIANEWDNIRKGYFTQIIRENAFSFAGVKPGKLAADIGAGTGFITEGLVNLGLRVIAVDQSEPMLEIIKQKLGNGTRIDYRIGMAEKLPIDDSTVDYAFANMSLHHVQDPLDALHEVIRILKPDGKLVVTDLDKHNFEFLKHEHHDVWLGFNRHDVIKWYQKVGFNVIFIDDAEEDCCAQSSCGCHQAKIGIFLALGIK